jgi:hypothetical protein
MQVKFCHDLFSRLACDFSRFKIKNASLFRSWRFAEKPDKSVSLFAQESWDIVSFHAIFFQGTYCF